MGGLSIDQAIKTVELGAEIVVFGAPVVISGTEFKAADPDFEPVIRDLVRRVKAVPVPRRACRTKKQTPNVSNLFGNLEGGS